MNILQVSTSDYGGGAEGSGWNLFQAYKKRGHNSWLAVGTKSSNDPCVIRIDNNKYRKNWAKFWLNNCDLLNRRLGSFKGQKILESCCKYLGEPSRFCNRIQGYEDFDYPGTYKLLDLPPEKPDIVHCHNLHGKYFDLRVLPKISQEIPVILNLRDAWLLSGHCAHAFECERWKIGCGSCPNLKTYPSIFRDATSRNWELKKKIFRESKFYITAPSEWLINNVKQSMLKGIEYKVIPNGIDLSIFKPGNKEIARKQLGLPLHSKVILCSGNFITSNQFKDFETMEKAVKQLKAETVFVCLGSKGKTQMCGNSTIIFRDFEKNPENVALYYQSADIFIHAAKAEAFGKTITEAMACGIPVIASEVGGIPEQVPDGLTGFLIPKCNSKNLEKKIEELISDEALCERMGKCGVIHAQNMYGLEKQVDHFLKWYNEILEKQ